MKGKVVKSHATYYLLFNLQLKGFYPNLISSTKHMFRHMFFFSNIEFYFNTHTYYIYIITSYLESQ